MKSILAAATFAGLALTSTAEAADTKFVGHLVYTASTPSCTHNRTGNRIPVSFYPASVGTNADSSAITLKYQGGAENYTLSHASFGTTFQPVAISSIFDFNATDFWNVSIKFSTQVPAVIDPTTNFVKIAGRLKGVDDIQTCIHDFRMIGVRTVF